MERDVHAGHQHATSPSVPTAAPDVLGLKESSFDFGQIPQGKPVYHSFELVNRGTAPLLLENIQTTCGCTTPEWSKSPVAPGKSTLVKVGFNAAAEGPFDKIITVQYNGTGTKQIKITGIVWKAPISAAPANPSIQFLKQQIQ
ncbi:MAG: DUF1573 domain-containing protein [Chitinophagaceae bacterium]